MAAEAELAGFLTSAVAALAVYFLAGQRSSTEIKQLPAYFAVQELNRESFPKVVIPLLWKVCISQSRQALSLPPGHQRSEATRADREGRRADPTWSGVAQGKASNCTVGGMVVKTCEENPMARACIAAFASQSFSSLRVLRISTLFTRFQTSQPVGGRS